MFVILNWLVAQAHPGIFKEIVSANIWGIGERPSERDASLNMRPFSSPSVDPKETGCDTVNRMLQPCLPKGPGSCSEVLGKSRIRGAALSLLSLTRYGAQATYLTYRNSILPPVPSSSFGSFVCFFF